MINIVLKNNEIRFIGHAMYDDYGKDIVCAGVSTLLTTTVNAILKFDSSAVEVVNDKDVILKIKKKDDITQKLIENMIEELYELEEQYPQNIRVKEDNNE